MSVHSSAASKTTSLDEDPIQTEYSLLVDDDQGRKHTLKVIWQPVHKIYKLEFPPGYPMRMLLNAVANDINDHKLHRVFTKMILQIPKTVHKVDVSHLWNIKDRTRLWLVVDPKSMREAINTGTLKVRYKAVELDYATKNYKTSIELSVRTTND